MKEDAAMKRPFITIRRQLLISHSARRIQQFAVTAIQIGAEHQVGLAVAVTRRSEYDSTGIDGDSDVIASIWSCQMCTGDGKIARSHGLFWLSGRRENQN